MTWSQLQNEIIQCQKCPRLIQYCQSIANEKRKSYRDQEYWARPVPHFGSGQSELLIVGLAPAAHGANRTGRMFTGDRSGEWLYRALYDFGFANQPTFETSSDNLKLINTTVTTVAHCAPPQNKPTLEEIKNCSGYLQAVYLHLNPKVIIALGQIAWNESVRLLKNLQLLEKAPKFSHGESCEYRGGWLIGSYHPSQQNTFTGVLTRPMFDSVFRSARRYLKSNNQ